MLALWHASNFSCRRSPLVRNWTLSANFRKQLARFIMQLLYNSRTCWSSWIPGKDWRSLRILRQNFTWDFGDGFFWLSMRSAGGATSGRSIKHQPIEISVRFGATDVWSATSTNHLPAGKWFKRDLRSHWISWQKSIVGSAILPDTTEKYGPDV